jgi:hemerythrin-like domain-containing protein
MKSTDFLMQEHKVILRALDVLDAIGDSINRTEKADQSDIDRVLDFLRWFADGHHQAKEETILFPALKQAAASQDRPVEHLNLEHDQERSMVEDLEADLRLAKLPEFVARAQRLSSTLRNHIYKEDRILFESVETALTAEQDDVVLERLKSFDTALDKQNLEEKLRDLHALEWKYLRR